ncbi:MAG: HD domain-containing protein [Desulfovibrionaceae bacterium]|nr:HD domain-containing protein [Desulfovibrionaceae bacterium]
MQINNEDYFQINSEILASFPKFRLPLNLFILREDISILEPYYKKGTRMTEAQVEELAELCRQGNIFVARSDQKIYRKHMLLQVDLALQDPNLTGDEIAEIAIAAVALRYKNYYEQPVPDLLELLYRDVMVITEYLSGDNSRILPFIHRLFRKATPAKQAINTMIVGTWLWLELNKGKEFTRKELDRVMLALVLHDIGMCKVPDFLIAKTTRLNHEEMEKVEQHPVTSVKIMHKSDLKFDELIRACFEHHERLDGSGYPQRAKGAQISFMGKLTAVADSFAAMITDRCYAKAKDYDTASQELFKDARYDKSISELLVKACAKDGPFSFTADMDAKLESMIKD